MKKRYVALAVAGLVFGYMAKMNYWFEDERDVYFPITKEQLRSKVRAAQTAKQNEAQATTSAQVGPHTSQGRVADLGRLSQNVLFNEIYNNKVLTKSENQGVYFEMIRSRLEAKYPTSTSTSQTSPYEREVANRLGLLRAMSQFWPNPNALKNVDQKQVKHFFYSVAKNKNENIMIRRQAYKNWLTFGGSNSQAEKTQLAVNADSRLLHLVSLSDENLIESLTESEE